MPATCMKCANAAGSGTATITAIVGTVIAIGIIGVIIVRIITAVITRIIAARASESISGSKRVLVGLITLRPQAMPAAALLPTYYSL